MENSSRQQVVYDTWENTDSNILIQAVAGSGKTTTLMGILERSKYRTLFVAFNKSIQEEIQAEIEQRRYQHAKAMTLHALGLDSIRLHFKNSKKIKINNGKIYSLLKFLQETEKTIYAKIPYANKGKVNITLIELYEVSRLYLTDDLKELEIILNNMDKYFYKSEFVEILWKSLIEIRDTSYLAKEIDIDFTDMIYLPLKLDMMIAIQPYYLMIDEAQDLNLAQHKLIDKLINQGDVNKWVAVGDRHQSIYGFSGAFGSSFDLFLDKENVVELPLDVCYRCPTLIVDEANKIYDIMTPFKTNEGVVEHVDCISYIEPGSMVICRNTGPLVYVFFALLTIDVKAYIKGDDILATLLKFLKPYLSSSVSAAKDKMSVEISRLSKIEKRSERDNKDLYRLKENYSIFTMVLKHFHLEHNSVEILCNYLKSMFIEPTDDNVVMLSTIHKSKGLQANTVFILNEHLIPSPFATSKLQLEQETNLKYVARTRAKEKLYYLTINTKMD